MPTVTVVSHVFEPLARLEAASFDLPELSIAVVPHPVATNSDDELGKTAQRLVPAIMGALVEETAT